MFRLWLLLAGSLSAQTITSTLSGSISDPNGALVPGAKITAESAATGVRKSATTDAQGRYLLPFLSPGDYSVSAEALGFQKTTRNNLRLEVAQSLVLDLQLSLGAASQTVEVTAESAPLLNTEQAGIEHILDTKLIEDLPSAERSTMALITSLPGIIDQGFALAQGEALATNGNAQGPIGSPGNRNFFDSSFSASGGQASTNDVLLDGVSNTVADFNGIAISPPQDSVQEVKVLSGVFSAEYGRSGGGVVSFLTKGGGRNFHGNLYEYFQNGALNANGWQRNRQGHAADGSTPLLPRIPIKRNQFGGSLGGPIKGLKKTFFFYNYEGRRERNPFSKTLTLPTPKMRSGDLSELLVNVSRPANVARNADGSPAMYGQLYNPYGPLVPNGVTNAAGAPILVRETIPGNRLDRLPRCAPGPRSAPCLDPVALNLISFLPLPNQPGLTDNYLYSGTAEFRRDLNALRIDHTQNEKHSFFGRFSQEGRLQQDPDFLQSVATNGRRVRDTFYNATFNDIFTLSPRAILNLRYGYTRARAAQEPYARAAEFDITTLGFPQSLAASTSEPGFPIFNFAGGPEGEGIPGEITGSQIGGGGNNQPRDTQTVAGAVSLFRGKHSIKTGLEYRLLRFFANQNTNPAGTYTFNRTFTRGPIPTSTPQFVQETGSSLASLFLGLPAAATFRTVTPITLYHHYGAAFIQDDWRPSSRLTLNLGLRWDVETATGEAHNQVTTFDLDAPSHLNGRVPAPADPMVRTLRPSFTDIRGLLSFPDGPQSQTNFRRFAPRAGFAFRLNDRTTLRGGYGMLFVPLSVEQTTALGVNFNTTAIQGTDAQGQVVPPGGASAPTVFLSNPFPNGIPPAPGQRDGADTLIGDSPSLVENIRRTSYTQQWNFVVQRLLAKGLVLDAAYVGTHGIRLPFPTININQLPTEMLDYAKANFASAVDSTGRPATSPAVFFSQLVANPFFGIVTNPNSVLAARTVRRDQLLKPFPHYNNPQLFRPLVGASKYNALQMSIRKTYSNGVSALGSYTWSKFMDIGGAGNNNGGGGGSTVEDIYNISSDFTLSNIDVPHRFTASFSYELPFAKRKPLLGGWQISGTGTWQSGTPVTVTANGFGLSFATRRPDRVYGVDAFIPRSTMQDNIRADGFAFNPDAYAQPPDLTLGNSARNQNDTRRDSYKSLNLSLLKNFKLLDGRHKMQLRGEFLNAPNLVVFGTPGRDVNDRDIVQNGTTVRRGNFARVRTQGNQPRIVQLVLRYTF